MEIINWIYDNSILEIFISSVFLISIFFYTIHITKKEDLKAENNATIVYKMYLAKRKTYFQSAFFETIFHTLALATLVSIIKFEVTLGIDVFSIHKIINIDVQKLLFFIAIISFLVFLTVVFIMNLRISTLTYKKSLIDSLTNANERYAYAKSKKQK